MSSNSSQTVMRPLRIGMIGGGSKSMIGPVHRAAIRLSDRYELVAGVFERDPQKSRAFAISLGIKPEFAYTDYQAMARDAKLIGLDAVSILTPNHLHVQVAQAFAEQGVNIISEKPLSSNLEGVKKLEDTVVEKNVVFALTHSYSAYPVVRYAQKLVSEGGIGKIRLVAVEYIQGWLSEPLEKQVIPGAEWRENPQLGGAGGVLGDIGTHAFQLAEFVSGLNVESLLAETSSIPGRAVCDDSKMLLRFNGGATGSLWCSQIAVGCLNGLRLRIFGEKGSLSWFQESPDELRLYDSNCTETIHHKGQAGDGVLPPGHPEGLHDAFCNVYKEAADLIQEHAGAASSLRSNATLPNLATGVRGLKFINAVLESANKGNEWVTI